LMAEALAMHGVVMNNGQACVMQRRILVPRHRQAAWVEALSAVLSAAPVGDAADPRTMIGPMIRRPIATACVITLAAAATKARLWRSTAIHRRSTRAAFS
jgi:acyl-CoA reductase-like NAD-dependent aldehyde dehydrogenase